MKRRRKSSRVSGLSKKQQSTIFRQMLIGAAGAVAAPLASGALSKMPFVGEDPTKQALAKVAVAAGVVAATKGNADAVSFATGWTGSTALDFAVDKGLVSIAGFHDRRSQVAGYYNRRSEVASLPANEYSVQVY